LKLVQERAGNTLEAVSTGKDFLSRTKAAQQLRERMDKWDFMKLKRFCTTKEKVSKLKRPSTEWEKIFAIYISDKGLTAKINRELKKLNSQKINDPVNNGQMAIFGQVERCGQSSSRMDPGISLGAVSGCSYTPFNSKRCCFEKNQG
jgi:hypothetical protein